MMENFMKNIFFVCIVLITKCVFIKKYYVKNLIFYESVIKNMETLIKLHNQLVVNID